MSEDVPNTYKAALRRAKPAAETRASTIRTALSDAVLAVQCGAWVSTKGDAFSRDLSGRHGGLQRTAGVEADEIDAEIGAQPEEVPPDSWQANWARNQRLGMLPQ